MRTIESKRAMLTLGFRSLRGKFRIMSPRTCSRSCKFVARFSHLVGLSSP